MIIVIYIFNQQIISQEQQSIITSDQLKELHSSLKFIDVGQSQEASNNIFNETAVSPNQQVLAIGLNKIIRIYQNDLQHACEIAASDIPGIIQQMKLSNQYLALLFQSTTADYSVRIYNAQTCVYIRSHQRTSLQLNVTGYTYNASQCTGDFQFVECQIGYQFALGCPDASRFNVTVANQSVQSENIGIVHFLKYTLVAAQIILLSNVNSQVGYQIGLSQDYLITNSDQQYLYKVKISDLADSNSSFQLDQEQITQDENPIQYLQLVGNRLFIDALFNKDNDQNIRLMEFDVVTLLPVSIFNCSITQIQKIQVSGAQILLYVRSTQYVLVLQQTTQVQYQFGNNQMTLIEMKVSQNYTVTVLSNSPAQSLFQKDNQYPSIMSKMSWTNRKLIYFDGCFFALNVLESNMLFVKYQDETINVDVTSISLMDSNSQISAIFVSNATFSVSFSTSLDCNKFQLQFENSAPIFSNYIKTGQICSASMQMPGKARKYNIKLTCFGSPITSSLQQVQVTAGVASQIKNAIIQPMIIRTGLDISVKFLFSDTYGNMAHPDCSKVTAQIQNVTSSNATRYVDLQGDVVLNLTFQPLNEFCIYNGPDLPKDKYVVKVKISDKSINISEQIGQQLIFKVNDWPFKFIFGGREIANLVIYAIYMIILIFVLPLLTYWLIEGKQKGINFFLKKTKKQKQKEDKQKPVQLQIENEKITGLGEVKIRGEPLLQLTTLNLNQLQIQDDELKSILTFTAVENKTAVHIFEEYKQIQIFNCSYQNEPTSLFIYIFNQETDFEKQLEFWNKLKIESKLKIIGQKKILKQDKGESDIYSALQTLEFAECVVVVTESIKCTKINNMLQITHDISKINAMKPIRTHGNLINSIFNTKNDLSTKIGPPAYQGKKYLLYGAVNNDIDMQDLKILSTHKEEIVLQAAEK
ncbi:Conserved_hypothetical protein [Hexamita inflata]|uniref:Transmembrane protein n=1 Tax=Hexamita inflata TaxID=28002 RepID=A0AA86P132_9EUKA|nr:Conserved hypothetical protein [Hexamita inflata]